MTKSPSPWSRQFEGTLRCALLCFQHIAPAVHITLKSAIMPLDGSATTPVGVTVIETSPVALGKLSTLVAPGPLTLKLKNVSLPVGSVVETGMPPVPVKGL